tara:strand:- start:1701 stop:3413 length:1713 start_codon:yes stop_codon:yes gene_type:complete
MRLKVLIEDKNYLKWKYYETDYFEEISLKNNINPAIIKLFTEDVFEYNIEENTCEIVHSVVRSYKNIAGVLIMNKSYGRKNQDKLYYKCMPHDKRLPEFLIAINVKKTSYSSFDKNIKNKYITFQYKEWNDKHPVGILNQTLGPTDNIINFFEYQLYSKNLNNSITQFTNNTNIKLKKENSHLLIENIIKKYKNIQNRENQYVFSIDPSSCQDYDDAFSFDVLHDNSYQISIYISNVAIILDYLNLWDKFSERVSTIYLPDRKRPMLPSILSDNLCSLKSGENRLAISLDLLFKNDELISINYKNVVINVNINLTYNNANELTNENYKSLFLFTKKISKKYKYLSEIKDSHDVVSYYMLLMNSKIAEFQEEFKNGIFRSVSLKTEPKLPDHLDNNILSFFKIYHSLSGKYSNFENRSKHNYLFDKETSYLHITSPIRRLVDLLNLIKFQENLGEIKLEKSSEEFYKSWLERLDYINTTMRSIKKVQNNCTLLFNCSENPEILDKEYKGYLFDKLIRNDGLFQYSVYLQDINLISKVIINNDLENYSNKSFKLFLFLGENDIKKKIRLKIL